MRGRIGDRVFLDGKKLGQPRRTGVISQVSEGLSGIRYQVTWDDGHESILSPSGGNLTIEARRAGGNSKRASSKARAKPKSKPNAKARTAKRKPAKRKPAKRKPAKRRR